MNTHPKVDEYIANSAEFARPILSKLRMLVHSAHPDITESIKWGMPSFDYKGIVCHLAAFKNHCSFGFMKYKLIKGLVGDGGMNSFGKFTSLEDLPRDELIITYVKEAVLLNEKGIQLAKQPKEKKELIVPEELKVALAKHPKAHDVFTNFAYTHQKEYIEWINEAKQEITKQKRVNQTIEWLLEGKHRNWKYKKC